MWISDLSQETIDQLCSALERSPILDWKTLMRQGFNSHPRTRYTELEVKKIESSKELHRAKALLDDLTTREISLDELVDGLRAIGNQKAVSIIEKDRARKCGPDIWYSGGRPPPYFSCTSHAQEGTSRNIVTSSINGHMDPHKDLSVSCAQPLQRREQSETLKHPVQESVVRDEPGSSNPELEAPLNWGEALASKVFSYFSCSKF